MHNNTTTNTTSTRLGADRGHDRSRRSVIGFGAGITATLLAGITFAAVSADAALQPDESTFVPIEPCRLFDTRPGEFNVGARDTPLGADDTHTQQVTGTNGNCTIPADATAVALNATAVDASLASFATFSPAGTARPLSSNLNYVPGQAPTPNKVDVKLSAGGAIDVYNAFGNVHLLADVMGYYRHSGIADLQQQLGTLDELQQQIDALAAVEPAAGVQVDSDQVLFFGIPTAIPKGGSGVEVMSVPVPADFAGDIVATFGINVRQPLAGTSITCGLDETSGEIDSAAGMTWESPGGTGDSTSISGTRAFSVDAGEIDGVYLTCRAGENGATHSNGTMTVTMVPND